MNVSSRRQFMAGAGISAIGITMAGCARKANDEEVSAIEDLMREHGVLRRALLVYVETAPKLRQNPAMEITEWLHKTAKLFRSFGEEYHEKQLEEAHIFPALKKAGTPVSALVNTLVEQHVRGRQITDYILAATLQGKLGSDKAAELAQALESFALMYQNHAAREDTVLFPAWKRMLPPGALEKLGDTFEAIEHEQFGADGFEDAVSQIAEIEAALGLTDLGQFTAPVPPSSQ